MDIIGNLKKFIQPDKVCIDNLVFRICTKVTFVILAAISVMVTSKQYIGDPIHCIVDAIPHKIMNSYCWFFSTYTLKTHLTGIVGRDIVQPGVSSGFESDDTMQYHRYYQWVCFALFFQAILCYIPRYIWKSFEGGRMKALSEELKQPLLDDNVKGKRKLAVINYFKEHTNQQSYYAYRFILCEILNFMIAIGQIAFTDYFLDGAFINYGIDVINHNQVDPMTRIFPKMTKCTFHKYGPSGSVQKFDGLCILPANILNEKVYLFLWFWFIGVSILSGIALVYRLCICCSPKFRFIMLQAKARLTMRRDIQYILLRFDCGDWFALYYLSKNIDPFIFREICRDLSRKLYCNEF